jgi:hypothetical protein
MPECHGRTYPVAEFSFTTEQHQAKKDAIAKYRAKK